ncbi:hypothetical protein [Gluconobacter frateurii]|uniref:Uncharacterized protein n=1 Tax=Gluconobacter frateurii NRIC 0228 TaxID=1307946 RepID=A0ABQ0QFS3_9PROT|nr:hypothetical protein [Gluconobacter frateurii]GBR17481.1 hypothetical protein AA0228_3038 [Gluconobacter frateurii NRIC 0228]GLP89616.1 hypothetical protein GCM10007868_06910 [Gluconobacter frateurii]
MAKVKYKKDSGTFKAGDVRTVESSVARCLKTKGLVDILEDKSNAKLVTK